MNVETIYKAYLVYKGFMIFHVRLCLNTLRTRIGIQLIMLLLCRLTQSYFLKNGSSCEHESSSALKPNDIHIIMIATPDYSESHGFQMESVRVYSALHGYHLEIRDPSSIKSNFGSRLWRNVVNTKKWKMSSKPIYIYRKLFYSFFVNGLIC